MQAQRSRLLMDAYPALVSEPRRALAILVVADDRALRDRLCADLQGRGCRVVGAADGATGLGAVVLERFDAIVTDVHMLPRSGLWLWREATTLRPELRGRFVFCSSDALVPLADGPWRSERVLQRPLGADGLWAEILAVTAPRPVRGS
ncbi:MAG TPA: hypothetical protein VEU55_00270 [Gemmatimonadales bacterium]|nr:hypothetical protein [Gemmatimonadales bacterium]